MKILVTGAFGNLGAYMAQGLSKAGHIVGAAGRNVRKEALGILDEVQAPLVQLISMDCTDENQVELVLAAGWDAIVHLASANDNFLPEYAKMALDANTWATRVLLEKVSQLDKKPHLVYFSTFHVYGKSTGTITEETPVAPVHDYASTHFFAEEYVRQFHRTHQIPFTIIRLTNSYGAPLQQDSSKWYLVLNDLAKMAFETKTIKMKSNGLAQRDFVWMPDVVDAVHRLLEIPATNTQYNLGRGKSCRLIEIAEAVQSAYFSRFGEKLPIEMNLGDTAAHEIPLVVQIDKLQSVISFQPEDHFETEALRIFALLEGQGSNWSK